MYTERSSRQISGRREQCTGRERTQLKQIKGIKVYTGEQWEGRGEQSVGVYRKELQAEYRQMSSVWAETTRHGVMYSSRLQEGEETALATEEQCIQRGALGRI